MKNSLKNLQSEETKGTKDVPKEAIPSKEQQYQIDISKETRRAALAELQKRTTLGTSESNINILVQYIASLEQQIDVYNELHIAVLDTYAKTEVANFANRMMIKTLMKALIETGTITEKRLREIHTKEVLVEELPPEQRDKYLQLLSTMDLQNISKFEKGHTKTPS